jgi:glycosyltransferase involved in cell wall biosynthesis
VGYAARNAFNRLTGTITENVDRFVVLSEFQRARFEAGGIPPAALRVVPNVAPTDRVAATGVPPAGPVTFVGRVDPAKGVGEFIEAARRLPDIPFSLVGHVERELVTRLRIPENVRIRGFLRGAELDEAFREAGLVVCPSKWFEGFPNVIARALSHGRPVVGSRIGVIPELIADGLNGMVCEPQDAASLTAAIGRLWRDPRRRSELGATARSIAESRYSPSAVYTLWRKVYEELAAKT